MKFLSENNLIVPAVNTKQMKEIDRIAIEENGPNLFQMMENAGRNLAELTMKVIGKNTSQKILVLAGKGGNGGGGICAARHLINHGYDVTVCSSNVSNMTEVAAYQLHILETTRAKIISVNELSNENPDIIIDAIIGYSLHGQPNGESLEQIKWANNQLCIKISLDVPSGIDATTGKKSKNYIKPDLTLTLALPKTGLLQELTGELYLGDIGITQATIQKVIPEFDSIDFRNKYLVKLSVSN